MDSQLFRGTCCQASGWTGLGQTQGYRRTRQDYHVADIRRHLRQSRDSGVADDLAEALHLEAAAFIAQAKRQGFPGKGYASHYWFLSHRCHSQFGWSQGACWTAKAVSSADTNKI